MRAHPLPALPDQSDFPLKLPRTAAILGPKDVTDKPTPLPAMANP